MNRPENHLIHALQELHCRKCQRKGWIFAAGLITGAVATLLVAGIVLAFMAAEFLAE